MSKFARWMELWNIATSDPDGIATITPFEDDPYAVLLTWPDGSQGVWACDSGGWETVSTLDTAPCDVAARDAL